MEGFLGGVAYKAVSEFHKGKGKSAKDIAIDFLIYGTFASLTISSLLSLCASLLHSWAHSGHISRSPSS